MGGVRSPKYDYFVSYAHADRELVEGVAESLSLHDVQVWWDHWEMKPGDILRERINDGIESSRNYLLVVSSHSLSSSWVTHELNAAFIRSIEDRHVRVIAAIGDGVAFEDLPIDLRARYALDFRTEDSLERGLAELVDLAQPERRIRRDLLTRLRRPQQYAVKVEDLERHALQGRDQDVQVAALRGATSLQRPESVRICALRSVDTWGMKAIEASIRSLGQLGKAGGLLALTATVLFDNRYVDRRLMSIRQAARSIGSEGASTSALDAEAAYGPHFNTPSWAQSFVDAMLASTDEDLRWGACFLVGHAESTPWIGTIRPPDVRADDVESYFETRVPSLYRGLVDAFRVPDRRVN